MRKSSLFVQAAGLALASGLLSSPDLAQAAEEEASEEIIVTAMRDSRSLREAPMSITVATGEQIANLHLTDFKDVQQLAPGLELTNNTGRNNTATLRGISFDPDQGTSPSVELYFNEMVAETQATFAAIYDIEQIEILRGPQGTLRGQGAPAGTMLISSRKPNYTESEGYVQALGTTKGGYNLQGGFSFPLSDTLAIRVAGLADGNRINHVRNLTRGGERSESRTYSGRVTLGFKPNDAFEATVMYQYLKADNNVFQQVVGAGSNPYGIYSTLFGTPRPLLPASFGGGPFATDTTVRSGPALVASDYAAVSDGIYRVINRHHVINLNAKYDFGGVTLSMLAGFQRGKITTERDQDLGNALPGINRLNLVNVPTKIDQQEVRLESNNPDGFGWSVGVYHAFRRGLVTNDTLNNDLYFYNVNPAAQVNGPCAFGFPGCPGNFTPYTLANNLPLQVFVNVPLDTRTWSYNANLRYYSGPFKIEGGIRYTPRKNTQTTQIRLVGFRNQPYTEIINPAFQVNESKAWTGGVNVSYELADKLNVYASYGRAFRSPTTGVSTPVGITQDLVRTTGEKSDSFEIGLKGAMMDGKLNFTLAGYYQKIDGFIRKFDGIFWRSSADASGSGFFSFNYNGDASVKGVEAELNGRFTRNWDFGLSMAYAKGRYNNAKLPCNDFAGTGIPNQNGTRTVQGYNAATNSPNVSFCTSSGRLAETPDFSLTANTELRFPVGNVTPFVAALWTHRPGFFSTQSNFQYETRDNLNMFIGVRGPDNKWSLDVFARNVFNQSKITNISLGNALIAAAVSGSFDPGYRTVNTTNPREFGMTASFKF